MHKTIIEPSYEEYLRKVSELELKGFNIEEGHPPMVGFSYHAILYKPDKIPMTRAEVLSVARAARAAKAENKLGELEGEADNEQEETEE